MERKSSVAANAVVLELICVIEETAPASLPGWTLDRIHMVCKRYELRASFEFLNTDLWSVCEEASSQPAL